MHWFRRVSFDSIDSRVFLPAIGVRRTGSAELSRTAGYVMGRVQLLTTGGQFLLAIA